MTLHRLFLFVLSVLFLAGCSGDHQNHSPEISKAETGSLTFSIVYTPEAKRSSNSQTKAFSSCRDIDIVTATIYESRDGGDLIGKGQWDCNIHHGTLQDVKAGLNRVIIIRGRWRG